MIWWFRKIFRRKNYIDESLKERLKSDDNVSTDEIVETLRKEKEQNDEEIHNLLVEIMLLENNIHSEV